MPSSLLIQSAKARTDLDLEKFDPNSPQADHNAKTRHVRWNDAMDGCMLGALVHQLLSGHKRNDNGFSTFHVSKVVKNVYNGRGVVVSEKNVRVRLNTLKKEYLEVRQLLSMSGVGLDPSTKRVTADTLAWEEFLKGKPDFRKWRHKLCPRYDEFEAIFANDSATGDRSLTGNDNFSPIYATDENVNEDTDPSPVHAPERNVE
ncbi:hypothetical protein LguiA_010654 [Lonicera macranthoides]